MNPFSPPWLELAVLVPLLGAACVGWMRQPLVAFRWGLAFTGTSLACALVACLGYFAGHGAAAPGWGLLPPAHGRPALALDELSAPLLPVVALLHFLTALATARTKMRRFSFAWSLASESIRLAVFGCREPWLLVGFLIVGTVPPLVELVNRGRSVRVYALHMGLFVVLLPLGWAFVDTDGGHQDQTAWASLPLLAAVLIRSGAFPLHCWLTDWFENASFGNALLFVTPLTGVYAAVRLVLPVAPDWVLQGLGLFSLFTAVYAAGMALVQTEGRRFFAYLFLSHSSVVLVGLEMHTSISLTGALCLWFSVVLSLGGFGLTLRALEARFGRLSLVGYRGLYEHSPALAVCFLVTGLASVGFPGTLGYVATELLVDGCVEAGPHVGAAVVLAAALNGIAVLRAYFLLFTGTRHVSTVSLNMGLRERIAVLTLTALILGGGLVPQPNVTSRSLAADAVLRDRKARVSEPDAEPDDDLPPAVK